MNHLPVLDPARFAEFVKGSTAPVALTGAGISTAAGIPDFRGPRGLYVTRHYDPEKVFDIDWFYQDPLFFYEFSKDFVGLMKMTSPTFTHRFLAYLEQHGRLAGIITQNIDALHQEAGSENILELHGSYRTATCRDCKKKFNNLTYEWWDAAMLKSARSPLALCSVCGGVLKPDIVFFGETVLALEDARRLIEQCDLLMVLGSSLQVMPASLLPGFTNATTLVINKGKVSLSSKPYRFFIEADLDDYFREVALCLGMNC